MTKDSSAIITPITTPIFPFEIYLDKKGFPEQPEKFSW